jgi:glutathione S-transferase
MLKLYDYLPSQNGYKIRMLLGLLKRPYEYVPIEIFRGESREESFLQKNPAGAVPALETEPGRYIAESNAILCFLAEGSSYLPDDRFLRAKVLQWLFFEQYYIEPNIGTLRFWTLTGRLGVNSALVAGKRAGGERGLAALERQLQESCFLVGDACTIADLALFAYAHLAEDASFDLSRYPAIKGWIGRLEQLGEGAPPVHPYTPDAMVQS